MKRFVLTFLVCALLVTGGTALAKGKSGDPPGKSQGGKAIGGQERVHAKQAITRTALVIKATQKAVAKGGHSSGLGLALGHQKYALHLYKQGEYTKAIYHTLRARALAGSIIERNKGVKIIEINLTEVENIYIIDTRPKEAELDNQLRITFAKEIPADNLAITIELTLNL